MIEARDLIKIYAGKAAVDHLSFTVEPGQVTGFLGPRDVFPPSGPKVPESFDQAAPAPHSSAFSGLSDRRP